MRRWSSAAVVACGVGCLALFVVDLGTFRPAGASGTGPTIRVTPDRALIGGRAVTVAGRGFTHAAGGSAPWFVIECTAAVQGHMDPDRDAPHCDVTAARAVRVDPNGTFSTTYRVIAGIVGDGYCGTPGHLTCVLAVGTASGRGALARISFKEPSPPATPTALSG